MTDRAHERFKRCSHIIDARHRFVPENIDHAGVLLSCSSKTEVKR